MQSLYYRNTRFTAYRVNRGRGHDKGVVDMYELRLLLQEEPGKLFSGIGGPDNVLYQRQPLKNGIIFNLQVASAVGHHVMAAPNEELTLLFKGDVFAAGSLVGVVNEDNIHAQDPACRRQPTSALACRNLNTSPFGRYVTPSRRHTWSSIFRNPSHRFKALISQECP
jgi:hypothetical protein